MLRWHLSQSVLQVYGEWYVEEMGIIGFFPANVLSEKHVFVPDQIKSPITMRAFDINDKW